MGDTFQPGPTAPAIILGPHCFYCRSRTVLFATGLDPRACTRDHIFPRSWVRRTIGPQPERWHVLNRVWCCAQCNAAKGNIMPDAWANRLTHPSAQRLRARLVRLAAFWSCPVIQHEQAKGRNGTCGVDDPSDHHRAPGRRICEPRNADKDR